VSDHEPLREHISRLLAWEDAHVSYDAAVKNLEPGLRGAQPPGLPYSPWQLIEHLRIAQHDILDFCRNPEYQEMKWPDDYWPAVAEPPSAAAWTSSLREFKADREALQALAMNPGIQLEGTIPHGTGQTYARELLLAADHTAYHVGQLVVVRRLLGSWPPR
jgi:uncharacterized damage-inducible protein DinB